MQTHPDEHEDMPNWFDVLLTVGYRGLGDDTPLDPAGHNVEDSDFNGDSHVVSRFLRTLSPGVVRALVEVSAGGSLEEGRAPGFSEIEGFEVDLDGLNDKWQSWLQLGEDPESTS